LTRETFPFLLPCEFVTFGEKFEHRPTMNAFITVSNNAVERLVTATEAGNR
jgi:hypothetical protein